MPRPTSYASAPAVRRARRRARWQGAAMGALLAVTLPQLLSTGLLGMAALLVAGVGLGAWIGGTRVRWLLPLAAFGLVALLGVVVSTPLAGRLADRLVREDPLQRADAVVTLSSGSSREGTLDSYGTERLLGALELLADGWAPALVRTELPPEWPSTAGDVERLTRLAGLDVPILAAGPVESTRDEAVAVARLAAERGWRRIILVTSPVHSARAAAVFEGAGLTVISRPCRDRVAFRSEPSWPAIRLDVFQGWLHEEAGWVLYSARGWVR